MGNMARQSTTAEQLTTADRRAFVLAMRKTGATYRKIAAAAVARFGSEALPEGWDERYAYKDILRELSRLRETMGEDAEAIRQVELERLDRLTEAFWSRAIDGDGAAADRVLKFMERRARYLGLNRAEGIEVSGPDGEPLQAKIYIGVDPYELV